jgi:serine phosphatase RsbU (regulator of sigma subunit)
MHSSKKVFLFILFFCSLQVFAENVDSLRSYYKNTKNPDSLRLEALNDIAWDVLYSNPDSAYILGHEELEVARSKKLKKWEAKALNTIGASYQIKGNYLKAIEFYQQSLKVSESIGEMKRVASSLANIGSLYINIGEFEKALDYQNKSLVLFRKLDMKAGMASALNNIGIIYNNISNYEKALEYNEKGLKLYEELGDKQGIAAATGNIGNIYMSLQNYDKALEYQQKSLSITQEIGDKPGIASNFTNIGRILSRQKQYDKALPFLTQAISVAKESEDVFSEKEASYVLYEIYKQKNNPKKSLEYYENYVALRDSILKEDNKRDIQKKELEYEYEKKAAADSVKNEEEKRVKDALIVAKNAQIEQDKTQKVALFGGVILLILFGIFIYSRFRVSQQQKQIIEIKSKETEEQKTIIEEKQKEILSSISYAKRIQYTLLAHDELLDENLKEYFILFKPKDIVSGDFYWATANEKGFYLAVCDSTGHGVPGAFMSLLNISFLNEAINEKNIVSTNEVFNHVRKRLITSISADGAQDGMDAVLIKLNDNKIEYAAANSSPILVRNNKVTDLPYDKMPIGKSEQIREFNKYTLETEKGDMLYFCTDGYADQFGGEQGKKFKHKQLQELLVAICNKSVSEQKKILNDTFEAWKGTLEQVDDICIIGLRA